jgi:hypothetical protein
MKIDSDNDSVPFYPDLESSWQRRRMLILTKSFIVLFDSLCIGFCPYFYHQKCTFQFEENCWAELFHS